MMTEERMDLAAHLSAEDVAAYLDAAVTSSERARIEAHLGECAECRAEVVEVTSLTRSHRRVVWRVAAPLAAAAAVVAVVWLGPGLLETESGQPPLPTERATAPGGEGTPSIPVVGPTRGAEVTAADLEFSWRTPDGASTYRFTLTDERGSTLWTGTTSDTVLILPSTVGLEAGRVYFWYVDALMSDGRSATSGVRSFTVSR